MLSLKRAAWTLALLPQQAGAQGSAKLRPSDASRLCAELLLAAPGYSSLLSSHTFHRHRTSSTPKTKRPAQIPKPVGVVPPPDCLSGPQRQDTMWCTSELHHGKRSHGGPKLRFKDVLKRHLKKTGISHKTWEEEAAHRVKWQGLLRKAMSAVEEQRQQEYQLAHVQQHSAPTSSSFQCNNCQRYCRSRAGLIAHMRACLR